MVRILLINFILFMLPFMIYWVWMRFLQKRETFTMPHMKLASIGAFIAVTSFIILVQFQTADPEKGRYVPATYKDGVLIPGYFESEDFQKGFEQNENE